MDNKNNMVFSELVGKDDKSQNHIYNRIADVSS